MRISWYVACLVIASLWMHLLADLYREARFFHRWPLPSVARAYSILAAKVHSQNLVDLFHSWPTCTSRGGIAEATSWHPSFRHATTSTGSLVDLHHDGINHTFELFLSRLELIFLSELVFVKPVQSILDRFLDFVFVVAFKLIFQFFFVQGVAHGEAVVFQSILRFDFLSVRFIFGLVLLCLLHHSVDLSLRKASLFICDRDLVGLSCRLVLRRHIQNSVRVDVESDLDLRHTTWRWWDAIQVELSEEVVVLGHGTFTLEHLDQHTWLVVRVRRESLSLLSWDRRVPFDQFRHDAACCLQAHGKGCDIKKQQVLNLGRAFTCENRCLHRCSESHSF